MSTATTLESMQVEVPEDLARDPLLADAQQLGPQLARLLADEEDTLLVTVLEYAKVHDYAPSTSTIVESWRMSIRGLSSALCGALETGRPPPPIEASAPARSALTGFARYEAAKHRERGIDMRLFLGLLKYYRAGYLDVAESDAPSRRVAAWRAKAILRFFDHLEIEFTAEWLRLSEPEKIEELQRSNRRLTNLKNKFLTIFESLADPAFMMDAQGELQHVNEAATQTFAGLADKERYYGNGLPGVGLPELVALVGEVNGQGAPSQVRRELQLHTMEGPRTFLTSVRRMLDISGKFEGFVATLKDITDREVAERERQHLEIQLRHAQRLQAIDQLAAGLAHDINTPLQYLSSNLEFLQSSLQSVMAILLSSSPEAKTDAPGTDDACDLEFLAEEMPEAIQQSWEGLQQVRNTLITLRSFGEAGESSRRAFELNRSVTAVTDLLRSTFDPVVDFELELEADLAELEGDGPSMRQVLYDLLLNAGQAIQDVLGPHPDVPGRVVVRTRSGPEGIVLEVEDDGPGIPEHVRPHVFEPFFSTRGERGGGGQGLAYVHRTVSEGHGGEITFDCPEAGGCRFTIVLPRVIGA